ncbi:MAG: hypothetical protein AAFZ15_05650 [Bacteroidota bacterium]
MNFSSKIFTKSAFLLLLFGFVLSSCDDATSSESGALQKIDRYFDLKEFIESEVVRLAGETAFVKTVFVNGEKEEKVLESLDIENELKPFLSSDINKPAWSDKYDIDSLLDNSGNLKELTYIAKDEKLKTQLLSVKYQNKEVEEIAIKNRSKSSVAETLQELSYAPLKGYSIESIQEVSTIDKNHFKIQVAFQK